MRNTFFNNYFLKISKLLNSINFKELDQIYDLILKMLDYNPKTRWNLSSSNIND